MVNPRQECQTAPSKEHLFTACGNVHQAIETIVVFKGDGPWTVSSFSKIPEETVDMRMGFDLG